MFLALLYVKASLEYVQGGLLLGLLLLETRDFKPRDHELACYIHTRDQRAQSSVSGLDAKMVTVMS